MICSLKSMRKVRCHIGLWISSRSAPGGALQKRFRHSDKLAPETDCGCGRAIRRCRIAKSRSGVNERDGPFTEVENLATIPAALTWAATVTINGCVGDGHVRRVLSTAPPADNPFHSRSELRHAICCRLLLRSVCGSEETEKALTPEKSLPFLSVP
jgi:hypothetical protein